MDALYWDILGHADGDNDDGNAERGREPDDIEPVIQSSRTRYTWEDVLCVLGVAVVRRFLEKRDRRHRLADRERNRSPKSRAETPCQYCGPQLPSREQSETRRRQWRDIEQSCQCCSTRELPRQPCLPTPRPVLPPSAAHDYPVATESPNVETKGTMRQDTPESGGITEPQVLVVRTSRSCSAPSAIRESPTATGPLDVERSETTHSETPYSAQVPGFTDEKEMVAQPNPSSSLNVRVPKYTLGLMSPVRLVSAFCIVTGTSLFISAIGSRSPWRGGALGIFLAGGFAYHDVVLGELGWTTCGLNSILEWT
ncbi:hypothetical protein PG997_011661 [Apiospora hydei]|uniref:Uncharacterized protein n=1 Tax=Apiospora hydei TaxID=1337664 RepID=A0ABR1VJM6_9PEZI